MRDQAEATAVRVWDLPLRIFHWLLAASVVGAVITVKLGGNWMEWHMRLGVLVTALLAFRLVWGIVGPRYARFASFLYSPTAVWAYLRSRKTKQETQHAGHNPLGALSVYALLFATLVQVATGLCSSDSISVEGPLVQYLREAQVSAATALHHRMEWVLYGLIGLHIGAIVFYRLIKNTDLIGPMIHGDKQLSDVASAADGMWTRVLGLGVLLGFGVLAFRLLPT